MRGALLMAGWVMLVAPGSIGAASAVEAGPVTLEASELATIGRRAAPPPILPAPAPLVIEPPSSPLPGVPRPPTTVLGPSELGAVGRRVQPVPLPLVTPAQVAAPVTVAAAASPAFARPVPRPVMMAIVQPAAGPVRLDATRLSLIGP
jgi:hypothetical protein